MPRAQDSEADTIIRGGIPTDPSPNSYDQGARPPNAYVYREGMSRLVIYPRDAREGALFINIADIAGDIAPGH